jgi:NAD(P)-dependent dehydrogenase (short-subunit alcohol dehydrogenase family)
VTGGAATRPRAGATMVSAAFVALETLARGLAVELGPLRVNALRPGYTFVARRLARAAAAQAQHGLLHHVFGFWPAPLK